MTCGGVRRRLLGVGVCARRRALLLRADGARLHDTLLLCWPDGPRGRFRVEDVTRTSAEATPPPSGCRYNEPPRRGVSALAPAPPHISDVACFLLKEDGAPGTRAAPRGGSTVRGAKSTSGRGASGPWTGARAGWRRAAFKARAALTLSAPCPRPAAARVCRRGGRSAPEAQRGFVPRSGLGCEGGSASEPPGGQGWLRSGSRHCAAWLASLRGDFLLP